jgi:hypothetical protein
MGLPWGWVVGAAALHPGRGAYLWKSKVGLAAIGLHKVGFQPSAPGISKEVEAVENLLVRTGQESYDPQTTWPGGDSVPFLLIRASLARKNKSAKAVTAGRWELGITCHQS